MIDSLKFKPQTANALLKTNRSLIMKNSLFQSLLSTLIFTVIAFPLLQMLNKSNLMARSRKAC